MINARVLTKVYPHAAGPVNVLNGIDLDLVPGSFVAVTGASGSGKSTLLHVLGCLARATAGTYRVDGCDVAVLDDDALAALRNRAFGFVFQTSHFVDYMDLAANVALPAEYAPRADSSTARVSAQERRRATHERALALLADVGLVDRARHLPSELSGGERQRASFARALFNEPRLVLADEPTGNLDRTNADMLAATFEALAARGVAVLLVTHDERLARRAQLVYRLHEGALTRCR